MNLNPDDNAASGAGPSLWERVNREPRFVAAKQKIQRRYGLPLPFDIRHHYRRWQAWLGKTGKRTGARKKRGDAFLDEVHAVLKQHEVPEAWYPDFIADIAGTFSSDAMAINLPRFDFYQDEHGEWKWECTITPETDLTDPFILEAIQIRQKEYAGDPPLPAKNIADHRSLDWRPVYLWHKKHPLFSAAEIADRIGFAPRTVRRKLREMELGDGKSSR